MTTGLTILCKSRPSIIHARLSGCSDDGRSQAATPNSTAAVDVQGHMRPKCQPLRRLTTASAAAIASPNVRSEPGASDSSLVKLSWVDCLSTAVDQSPLDFQGPFIRCEPEGRGLFRPHSGRVAVTGRIE